MSAASDQSISQLYGVPKPGSSGLVVLDGTAKPIPVTAGYALLLTAVGGDLFWGSGDTTVAANRTILLSGQSMQVVIPSGASGVNVTQGPAPGGTAYYSLIP
jgi:hypothetical protein